MSVSFFVNKEFKLRFKIDIFIFTWSPVRQVLEFKAFILYFFNNPKNKQNCFIRLKINYKKYNIYVRNRSCARELQEASIVWLLLATNKQQGFISLAEKKHLYHTDSVVTTSGKHNVFWLMGLRGLADDKTIEMTKMKKKKKIKI